MCLKVSFLAAKSDLKHWNDLKSLVLLHFPKA